MKSIKRRGILLHLCIAILLTAIIVFAYSSNKGENWIIIVMAIIVLFLPALFSIIPHIENYQIKRNRNKDHLVSNTFTDREDDVAHILEKLLITEHIIEISGTGKQCGKTWIAKRVTDYINHPEEYPGKRIKFPYKAAYYFDLKQDSIEKIEDFFKANIINAKTVLIFDHVNNMDYILTKQSCYHFQLIYIMQDNCNYNFFKYNISIFQESKINDLQNNIRKNYFGIESISEDEIHTLYSLTAGNIGKIHAMLSSQKCVKWIKDINAGVRTDYDEELYKINMDLLIGEYQSAKNKLQHFQDKNEQFFSQNNALYYNYILIKADCEHLLNHYEDALQLLSIIEVDPYRAYNKNYEFELYKAHYYKHLWNCNEALGLLHSISSLTYSAKVDALGILLAKYFIDDLFVPYSDSNSLTEFLKLYDSAYSGINSASPQDTLKCQRCTAIYLYYNDNPSRLDNLVLKISEVIDRYQSEHDRLLANAYFIRGELYRLYGQYEKAVEDYARTTSVTLDNNIIVQTNLIIFYLKFCKKIDVTFNLLSENEIIHLCEKNNYAKIVWRRINSIRLNDPSKENIVSCFDNRIMPIL